MSPYLTMLPRTEHQARADAFAKAAGIPLHCFAFVVDGGPGTDSRTIRVAVRALSRDTAERVAEARLIDTLSPNPVRRILHCFLDGTVA